MQISRFAPTIGVKRTMNGAMTTMTNAPGVSAIQRGRIVTIKRLEKLGHQHRGAEQDKPEKEKECGGNGEIPISKQGEIHHGILVMKLPDHSEIKAVTLITVNRVMNGLPNQSSSCPLSRTTSRHPKPTANKRIPR